MYAVGGVGDLGKVVTMAGMAGILAAVALGCDSDGEELNRYDGPYAIVEVSLEGAEEADSWAPDDELVGRWFQEVLRESERGLVSGGEGMPVEATLRHEARVQKMEGKTQLVIEIDSDVVEVAKKQEESPLTMSTEAEFLHPLTEDDPGDEVLEAVSATVGRKALEETVDQLRNLAEVRQGEPWELVRWSRSSAFGEQKRLLAIQELAGREVAGAAPVLKNATKAESAEVAVEAAMALYSLEADEATHEIMEVAQRMSRDEYYEEYLRLLPVVGKLDAPWVSIYLDTVAQAHTDYRVRKKARSLSAER